MLFLSCVWAEQLHFDVVTPNTDVLLEETMNKTRQSVCYLKFHFSRLEIVACANKEKHPHLCLQHGSTKAPPPQGIQGRHLVEDAKRSLTLKQDVTLGSICKWRVGESGVIHGFWESHSKHFFERSPHPILPRGSTCRHSVHMCTVPRATAVICACFQCWHSLLLLSCWNSGKNGQTRTSIFGPNSKQSKHQDHEKSELSRSTEISKLWREWLVMFSAELHNSWFGSRIYSFPFYKTLDLLLLRYNCCNHKFQLWQERPILRWTARQLQLSAQDPRCSFHITMYKWSSNRDTK